MKKRTQLKPKSVLPSALKHLNLTSAIASLHPADLFDVEYSVRNYVNWIIGDPTKQSILELGASTPQLLELIDFDIVIQRLDRLETFERGTFACECHNSSLKSVKF